MTLPEDRWDRVGELFDRLTNAPPGERDSLLAESGETDDIKTEVRSLLQAHERTEGFLDDAPGAANPVTLPQELPTGTSIGPYRINRVAGRGGMGIVYDAEDTRLHRRVALKALPAAFDADEASRLRLRQEARAAAALQHPGIATIYALEEIDGGLFISSEFLEGETLREEMNRQPQEPARAVAAGVEIARALCVAHDRGIVHRDLKPENIVRTTDGTLKILDFGLAQFDEAASDLMSRTRLTQQGLVVGTPAYMAPEQLLGRPTDFRVDHFALGIMLYEMSVGGHPFGGGTLPSTIARILAAPPQLPALEQLPLQLWAIIERCLRKDPADRYRSTREFLSALQQVQEVQGVQQVPGVQQGHGVQQVQGVQPVQHMQQVQEVRGERARADSAPLAAAGRVAALKAWRFHQLAAAVAYILALWPAWHIHRSLGSAALAFFLSTLAAVVVAAGLRLNLLYVSFFDPEDLHVQRAQVARTVRVADFAFAALLIIAGIALPEQQIGWAALLISYGIGSAVAAIFVEPGTARAAFRDEKR